MRPLGGATAAIAALIAALTLAAPATAELGPIRLVSKSSSEQADEALATAISTDGRYLAFQGTIGGLKGIFREELSGGAIAPVATGKAIPPGAALTDARKPSISADGRYVSFTTNAALSGGDETPGSADVYVADMAVSPPAYELASAIDGSSKGLAYSGPGGSEASGRVALSADGRKIVFFTTAESDLTSGPGGSTEGKATPAGQVVLRDLETKRTTLVSAQRDPETGQMSEPALPVVGGAIVERPGLAGLKGAALSADGSTVAWLGGNLPAQVPLLADEAQLISGLDANGVTPYDEPLWRRVDDGPLAPTRRIVGGGDPLAPGCPAGGTLAEPACQGPFPGLDGKNSDFDAAMGWLGLGGIDGVPQLSADGRTVALIGNPSEATNVFLVDMGDGLSRRQAVRQLTREIVIDPTNPGGTINVEPHVPLNGHIFDLALSADGQRIAFATARQQFPLAPPNLLTPLPAQIGLVELYEIDLDGETLRRVTHGVGGISEASLASQGSGQGGAGASSPSFGAGGAEVAFSSTASNLVAGDANEASDAFLVEDPEASRQPGVSSISPGPRPPRAKRRWRLVLSASSLPSGAVRLTAVVPGAGALWAKVEGALRVDARPRRLAAARRRARGQAGGKVNLTFELPGRYRRLVHSHEGVYAMAKVTFSRRGRKTLHGSLQVRFHAHGPQRRHRGRG
jgi:hypothetical protein